MPEVVYLHLEPESKPPEWTHGRPFKAVVVATTAVSQEWQDMVSDWLVRSGCLYMMAWGVECGTWDDSVDHAVGKFFNFNDTPDESFVMTTWHENDSLAEVFWYAHFNASFSYADEPIDHALILDIGSTERREEMLKLFEESRRDSDGS